MTEKRSMTSKWFLSLAARGNKSADAFLTAHHEWLSTGELASEVIPILEKIESKEVLPTPGLESIMRVALHHVMAADVAKVEASLNKEPKTDKSYVSVIKNANGDIVTSINSKGDEVDLRETFELMQHAERWCQVRLDGLVK